MFQAALYLCIRHVRDKDGIYFSSVNMHKARGVLATTALVGSSYFYVNFRSHDRRALSDDEVADARESLAQITPPPTRSISACATQSRDALIASHIHNLNQFGATVVKATLSPRQLDAWNARVKEEFDAGRNIAWNSGRAHCSISDRSVHYAEMTRVGSSCDDNLDGSNNGDYGIKRTNSSWLGGFWKKNKAAIDAETYSLVSLHHIVQSFFEQHGIERYIITQLQFLNAFPNSCNQIWHRDNKFRGLTAIVALQDIRGNGPTELILESHQRKFSLWPKCWNIIQYYLSVNSGRRYMNDDDAFSKSPLLGCIDAGDTILYDARIFHRGRGNISLEAEVSVDRPVLVLRWDARNTPPPGAGLIATSANRYIGSMNYAILFALQKIGAYYSDEKK
jgi:ectoine hydroxylase-related dioxygenase (phytanoyl-CoA dioxygenase family)